MRYELLIGKLQGKAADELSFLYNTCAWLQSMHNTLLDAEQTAERAGEVVSPFDKDSRLSLRQLFVVTSARYHIIALGVSDASASATLREVVLGITATKDIYCPALDLFAAAEQAAFVRQAGRRHGERRADNIMAETAPKRPGGGGAQQTKAANKAARTVAAGAAAAANGRR